MKGNIKGDGEFTIIARDSNKTRKILWNDNALGRFLRQHFSRFSHKLRGNSHFGYWDTQLVIHNLVTDAGLALLASRCNGAGAEAAADYLAVGTGTTAAAKGDTTLETEIADSGLARAQDASPTRETTVETNDTAVTNYQWTVSGTKAVTEAGCLNAASSGDLLAHQVFAAINVASGDTLEIIYKFQFTTS